MQSSVACAYLSRNQELEKHRLHLEEMVADRTAELSSANEKLKELKSKIVLSPRGIIVAFFDGLSRAMSFERASKVCIIS